ncbi:unnamed protein product [Sphagnum jensenii]|uniref:Uncharacterized protein n=1 Tax=Sphagnum jensenii TaxID=128206 RepID=A0ABP1AB30_9BRYO
MSIAIKRRRPQYFDRQQQLDLALAAQRLSELGDPDLNPTSSDDEDECEVRMGCVDIWEDADCLALLREGVLVDTVDSDEGRRIRRRDADGNQWERSRRDLQIFSAVPD